MRKRNRVVCDLYLGETRPTLFLAQYSPESVLWNPCFDSLIAPLKAATTLRISSSGMC